MDWLAKTRHGISFLFFYLFATLEKWYDLYTQQTTASSKMASTMDFLLNNSKVRCRDVTRVERKLRKLIEGGIRKLMVISDFDYTISRYHNSNGDKCWTSYGVFETSNSAACSELNRKCEVLKAKYLPIEYDPCMSIAEKIPYMEEWWYAAHNYIIEARLTHEILEQCVRDSKIELRDDVESFFTNLYSHDVPLIIFSAGIGNVIEIFLRQKFGKVMGNTHIISNMMEFDNEGCAIRFLEPLIHTFCKNASVIGANPVYFNSLTDRTNVLLMGDSLGDLDMDIGVVNKDVVLKIGFLNFNIDALLDKYLDGYDIVLIDDQSMSIPQHIIQSLSVSVDYHTKNARSRKLSNCRSEVVGKDQGYVEEDEDSTFVSTKVLA